MNRQWCTFGSLPRDTVAMGYRFCVKLVTGPQFVACVDMVLFENL